GQDSRWQMLPFTLARPVGHTPSPYRAPELGVPDAEPTAASDLYGVGALLYYVLAGWPPPTAEQQAAGAPLPSPRTLNPALSTLVEQALLRAVQLRSPNRYQTAREMRVALETVQMMGGRSLGLGPDVLSTTPAHPAVAPGPQAPQPYPPQPAVPSPGQPYPTGLYPAPGQP